jgi:hypothetical protein
MPTTTAHPALATLAVAAVVAVTTAPARAQTATAPPCPPTVVVQADRAASAPGQTEVGAAVPIERSGILPSAGNHMASAAPTVQQHGSPMRSAVECPLPPSHPNALPPGARSADVPDVSPAPPRAR